MRVSVGFRNCLHQNKWKLSLFSFNRDYFDDKGKKDKLPLREVTWLVQVHVTGLQRAPTSVLWLTLPMESRAWPV